jgi:hypothetical protein
MPRKTLKERNNPTDDKNNRLRKNYDDLIGIEDPDDIMLSLLEVLKETTSPSVGKFYTFVYRPKTSNIRYDEYPLVAITELFQWGFKGINFHWGGHRQYTWNEIIGPLHIIYPEELKDAQALPFKKIRLNN